MTWWQIILVLLFGLLPNLIVLAVLLILIQNQIKEARGTGEIMSQLKGIERVLNRIEKAAK